MFFSAFMDESGIGHESGHLVLPCVVARQNDWKEWEWDIYKLQGKGGFIKLHATELYNEIAEHGDTRFYPYVYNDIAEALRKRSEFSVVSILSKDAYKADYIADGFPKKCRPESQYSLCLKYLLIQVTTRLWDMYGDKISNITFVAEKGSKYDQHSQDVYSDFLARLTTTEIRSRLSETLWLKDNRQKDSRTLFAPDFLGWFVLRLAESGEIELVKPQSAQFEELEQKIFVQDLRADAMRLSRQLTLQEHEQRLIYGRRIPKPQP